MTKVSQKLTKSSRTNLFSLKRCRRKGEKGATMAEFAIVLPMLLSIIMGSIDVARFIYVHNIVQNAVNIETRRLLVRRGSDLSKPDMNIATIRSEMKQLLPNTRLFKGFRQDSSITADSPTDGSGRIMIRISIEGSHNLHTMRLLGSKTIKITGAATLPFQTNYPAPGAAEALT